MSDIRVYGYHLDEFIEMRQLVRLQKIPLKDYVFIITMNQLTYINKNNMTKNFDLFYTQVAKVIGCSLYIERN